MCPFYVCSANVAQRLRARAGLLRPKREPDDNDEVCSHPANETPRSAPSLHAMQISLTPAMNQTQCFSSQHFSKAIIHKGHAKGTLHPRAATLGGKKGQADLRTALCCVLSIRRNAFFLMVQKSTKKSHKYILFQTTACTSLRPSTCDSQFVRLFREQRPLTLIQH